jgi:hypothetical protein
MKRYETWTKMDTKIGDGRYYFLGWYPIMYEEFVIKTRRRGKYLYKTYKWANGDLETLRYTIDEE